MRLSVRCRTTVGSSLRFSRACKKHRTPQKIQRSAVHRSPFADQLVSRAPSTLKRDDNSLRCSHRRPTISSRCRFYRAGRPRILTRLLSKSCNTFYGVCMSEHSGSLTSRSVHPASPILLTKSGPLTTPHSGNGESNQATLQSHPFKV